MARGPLELQLSCRKRAAFDGETEARIKIFLREATMNCGKEAAFNGETQARIKILSWDASMNCERGAALNGQKSSENENLRGAQWGPTKFCRG